MVDSRSGVSIAAGVMPVLGRDADEAQEWVRSWTEQVSTQARAAAELSDRVSMITASATDLDGAIRVTVASSGVVTGLDLDDRVRRLPGRELAEIIMATMRRAQAGLADRVTAAVRETVGTDSETGRTVLDSYSRRFPQPAEDDRDGRAEDRRGW